MKSSNLMRLSLGVMLACLVGLAGCDNGTSNTPPVDRTAVGKDKIYKGELLVLCDGGLEPILKQQVDVFEFVYDSVNVDIAYRTEGDVLQEFRKRKSGVAVLSRAMDKAEKDDFIKRDTLHIREMPVAYDAVAMIGNVKFDDSKLTLDGLKGLFDPRNIDSKTRMVFEDKNSSTVNYVLGKLGYTNKVSSNVNALNSVDEVIAYVEKNTEAIGFIPYSFISDADDEKVQAVLKRIKILSLHTVNKEGEKVRVSANQSDIADGSYPLIRTINVMSRFTYSDDLEWLFMNFLYKEKGARIFLKAGLIPIRAPEREINVNTGDMKFDN